jgi:hypothetical protein
MQRAEDRHRGGCYKQSYASYKRANCESFEGLLDFLKKNEENNGPIISYSRVQSVEHTYQNICRGIKNVRAGGPINSITRSQGLRAKVAELVLANNYGSTIPDELLTFDEETAKNITVKPYNIGNKPEGNEEIPHGEL